MARKRTLSNIARLAIWTATLTAMSLAAPTGAGAFDIGPLAIGGAMRANYIYGSYQDNGTDAPQRGSDGGNFELDTFRINLGFEKWNIVGKVEYRWYNGYNFLHTGWIGYNFPNESQLQLGVNRVPFGVGPYGPSNSWFFDQHYYVGLSDDMDLGVKYHLPVGNLALDVAYYLESEPNGFGVSRDSARYSYDIVNEESPYSYYVERNQVNLRAIYAFTDIAVPTAMGVSAQWGQLDSRSPLSEDTDGYAVALHAKSTYGPWTLMVQVSRYEYNPKYDPSTGLSNNLVGMGAYDFEWPVAARGTIPAVALSYTWNPVPLEFIDSIRFYNDWSMILKDNRWMPDGTKFNNSMLNVTGMSIARGGWFIYVDFAQSDGNYFVGNIGDDYASFETVGDFGVDGNNRWNYRFNINFGYYF